MSGGHFDYQEYRIDDIADEVEQRIVNSENPDSVPEDQRWGLVENPEVLKELKRGLKVLRQAYIYAHRIDYLMSGDDGEESFLRRTRKELSDLEATFTYNKDIN